MHLLSMSAPAWGFFGILITVCGGILQQSVKARKSSERTEENTEKVRKNTLSIGNGFAEDLKVSLTDIHLEQMAQGRVLREHLKWHLEKDNK